MPAIKVRGRSRLAIRIRHLKLAKAIVIDGKNYKEACLAAGYPELTANRDSTKIVKKAMPEIQELMDLVGLTHERLLQKGSELLEAKQYSPVTVKDDEGKVKIETWEAPDPRVQQRNLELMTEIRGVRRWGPPGTMNAPNFVQLNVSFGGSAQGGVVAGQKAMPISVKVVPPQQDENHPPGDFDSGQEDGSEPGPTGHSG